MDDDKLRLRAKRKLLRVTLPDGRVICRTTAADTMIDTLLEIDPARYPEITLVMSHFPLLGREKIPRFKEFMKPVTDGWWLNTQSNTDVKYLQLKAISDALDLGFIIEIGSDFEPDRTIRQERAGKKKQRMVVRLEDGEAIECPNSGVAFMETVRRLGVSRVKRCNITRCGRPLIAMSKSDNSQEQLDDYHWISMPPSTRDRAKLLKVIAAYLRVPIEVTIE